MSNSNTASRLDALLWDIAFTYIAMDKILDEVQKELEDEDKEAEKKHRERWDFIDQ